ncbi:hypothetical protein [Longispora albida]|uniref:hypothetical protein n=1 Tax=Longispora albida TaxID=203523 RepID=UPI000380DC34|nr:hypothetical protein [Longispora albida]
MTENHETQPDHAAADATQPAEEAQLTRAERRAKGKQIQQQHGFAPPKGKGSVIPARRSYSNRRSG